MGHTVYASGEQIREGAHVYCHSRKDGKEGRVYLVINNSAEATKVELPCQAQAYVLGGNGDLRSRVMYLNGKPLTLGENDELPAMDGESVSGTVELPAYCCAFYVL